MTPGAALLVALLSQSPSGAPPESAPTKLSLNVRAPADCTSRADLAARITARSPRIEVADDGPIVAQVVITAPRAGGAVADIVLGTAGTDQTPRRVVARSCAEAADSAALIIAVTLDPLLRRKSTPGHAEARRSAGEAATPAVPPQPGPAAAPAPPPAPRAPPPPPPAPRAPPLLPPPPPPVAAVTAPRPPIAPPPASRRELSAALGAQTISGAVPAILPGVALYGTAGLDRQGLWSPALVLGLAHAWRSDLDENGGAASFTLDALSLDACPLLLRWSGLAARPCASGLIARLASQGSNTPQTAQAAGAVRPFGAAGAALSATWGSRWQLFARLGLGVTLLRDSYALASVFYRAAPVTLSATLGVGTSWR